MAESPVRVLLVDDDEDELVIIGDLLRPAGPDRFELSWASTYDQGLQAIRASSCDVCLVDYRLGERNGLDLLVEVTAEPGHPEVILLTGEGDPDVDATAAKSGAADYLLKGELTPAVLERSIRYAVERGRMLRDLRDATELAQTLNLAKSAFLSSMSHEIRTPMNAILGMSEMLWESPLDAEQTQYVEVIRSAGSGLLVLINEILDLSKIEAGRLELERVAFDLETVVEQAIDLVAVRARAKNIALLWDVPPGTATRFIGDPNRLRQILVNLLGNAVKFTGSGKIVLTARNHESGKPGLVEIAVADTGIGIPAGKLETIFDDFTQAESSTTRKFGGTGLGLGISRRLVEAMGGRLVATSVEGEGSTFRFTAQFDPAEESNALQPVETVQRRDGQRVERAKILIGEDFEDNCFLIRAYLKEMPYELTFESNGKAVISRLSNSDFDLILMDVQMPEMDGLTATRAIRALERAQGVRAIPIIAMTANASPQDVDRSTEAGCTAHLSKPVSKVELLRAIEQHRRPAGMLGTEQELEVLSTGW